MKRVLVAIFMIAACSNGGSPPVAPPPAPVRAPPPPAGPGGQVVAHRFTSAALGVTKDVVVYLPAGYDAAADRRWPVFYYLHGLTGDERNWIEGARLDAAADAMRLGAIVVMPDGDDGFYADSLATADHAACLQDGTGLLVPTAPKRKTCVRQRHYETYITRDLIGWVDTTFRTIATRDGRAIAGLSMGGFGAWMLALRHPELFVAAASHSGVVALLYAGPFPYAAGKVTLETEPDNWGGRVLPFGAWVRAIFGPDITRWREHDPAALVATLGTAAPAPALYLDCGTEDEFRLDEQAQYVHDLLLARGIEHAWHLGPGHHDFAFWSARLPHSLAFLRDHVTAAR